MPRSTGRMFASLLMARAFDVVDDLFGSGRRCEPGAICDLATETCVAHIPSADGAPCAMNDECASRQCDDGFCIRGGGGCTP